MLMTCSPVSLFADFFQTVKTFVTPFVAVVILVLAFSSLARVLGECSIIHSLLVLFF